MAAATIRRLEKELSKASRGSRQQKALPSTHLPAGFVEATDPTITIPASAGQPAFEMGEEESGGRVRVWRCA